METETTERTPLFYPRSPKSDVIAPTAGTTNHGYRNERAPFYYSHNLTKTEPMRSTGNSLAYDRFCKPHTVSDSHLEIPKPPARFLCGIPGPQPDDHYKGTQSSFVTIFVIWNTMMGTSTLAMPYAIKQAGFVGGILLMMAMGALCFYTAYRVITVQRLLGDYSEPKEFSDMLRNLLGRWADVASVMFSLVGLLGAIIVYWILSSNFLYFVVCYIHDVYTSVPMDLPETNISYPDVICRTAGYQNVSLLVSNVSSLPPEEGLLRSGESLFDKYWHLYHTVPFVMILILGPVINFKSAKFFSRFSAIGTLSVAYMITFITCKVMRWGIHLNFTDTEDISFSPHLKASFPALTGIMSLAFFIHNCITSIMKVQRNPEKNGRDLSIAYLLVSFTYIFIGAMFYAAFPLSKSCIEDNVLNNLRTNDLLAFFARLFLFFQLVTVCPMVTYIFRVHFMYYFFGNAYPSFKHVFALNCVVVSLSVFFAVCMPQIGTIIRFTGSFVAMSYIFAFPCLAYMAAKQRFKNLSLANVITHTIIIILSVLNFLSQFALINDS